MVFASRADAGRKLGGRLRELGVTADLVLGLPRGGVIVAAEVARLLSARLDVLVVRKIGHPFHREFAVGALADGNVVVIDDKIIGSNPMVRAELVHIIEEEQEKLRSYQARFRGASSRPLEHLNVLLVDDGLATGATTEAAVRSARKQGARHVAVAAPVASSPALDRLAGLADRLVVLLVDPEFDAVGRYYAAFTQTTDEEVLQVLTAAKQPAAAG